MAPNALPYWIIGGAVAMSFVAVAIAGFSDAWFLPLVVIAICAVYAVYDVRLRRRERSGRR